MVQQRDSGHLAGRRQAGQAHHGGGEINMAREVGIGLAGHHAARQTQHQRHLDHLVVEGLAMPPALMLVKLLAVVGGKQDHRIVVESPLAHTVQERADVGVHILDFGAIGVTHALEMLFRIGVGQLNAGIAFAGVVVVHEGVMGVHVVQKQQEGRVFGTFGPSSHASASRVTTSAG